jgi:hypothetical protein
MTDLDPNNLRRLLDEEEAFAAGISLNDPRAKLARRMLGLIRDARRSLFPSSDSTANFVDAREIVAELARLREQIDK